jgi:hypothetical protein
MSQLITLKTFSFFVRIGHSGETKSVFTDYPRFLLMREGFFLPYILNIYTGVFSTVVFSSTVTTMCKLHKAGV